MLYYLSAGLLGLVLFEFGTYVALLGVFINATKFLIIALTITLVLFLWKRFARSRVTKLPHKSSI